MRSHLSFTVLAAVVLLSSLTPSARAAQPVWAEKLPLSTYGNLGVWDPVRHRLLAFGREGEVPNATDVWAFDPETAVWSHVATTGEPAALYSLSGAFYDSKRDRVILARSGDRSVASAVWALDLSGTPTWSDVPGGTNFNSIWGVAFCYDSRRDRMLAFGGASGLTIDVYYNTVYALDFGTVSPAPYLVEVAEEPIPDGRSYSTAVYDSLRDRMVVFGGRAHPPHDNLNSIPLDETWELSFAGTPTWRFLAPETPVPPARYQHAVAHDRVHDRMVIFGGLGSVVKNDVWSLDLADSTGANWVEEDSFPDARAYLFAVHDANHDRFLLSGGTDLGYPTEILHNEVLARSGHSGGWIDLTPESRPPHAGAAVYDSVSDRLMILATSQTAYEYDEAWGLANGRWSRLSDAFALRGTLVPDPARNRVLSFGGSGDTLSNEVRALDLSTFVWTTVTPTGTPPPVRAGAALIVDPIADRLILFGGRYGAFQRYNDVWSLSLSGTPAWTEGSPAGTKPSPRAFSVAAFDPARNRMIVAAGNDTNGTDRTDVWALTLDSSPTWTHLLPTGTGPGVYLAAILDPVQDRLVVAGGYAYTSGRNVLQAHAMTLGENPEWSLVDPAGRGPYEVYSPSFAYDSRRRGLLLAASETVDHGADVWGLYLDETTPVRLSLVDLDVESDRVALTWYSDQSLNRIGVERRDANSGWRHIGYATATTSGRFTFEDRDVASGARYWYRPVIDGEGPAEETEVLIPANASVTFGVTPNPSRGISVAFTLPASMRVEIEVSDVAGRTISRRAEVFPAGVHRVVAGSALRLTPGLYLVRARMGDREFHAKALVVR